MTITVGEYIRNTKLDSLDCRLFIEEVCSLSSTEIITKSDRIISSDQLELLDKYTEKRLSGLPVAYILGHKDFYKSTFITERDVLIPRPDTEILVEAAVKTLRKSENKDSVKILDLCAGTGCIGISTALDTFREFREVFLHLTDISEKAFNCFSQNAEKLLYGTGIKLKRTCGNLFSEVSDRDFDVIVTNPPYIDTEIIPTLSREVRTEPVLALDGGSDGLDLIRKIVEEAPLFIRKGGWLLMEIGYNQAERVSELFRNNNFEEVSVLKDLGGNDRVVKGRI